MGNNNTTSSPPESSSSSSHLTLEIIPEDQLNYEEMTKAPPETMALVRQSNQPDGAFTTPSLPWPTYILDAWYTPQLAPHMVSRPQGSIKLTKADVQLLQSRPESTASEQLQELADRVQSQFPTTTTTPAFQCFVRLSMCSTKVGAHAKPASSGMEVVQQILISHRCVNSLSCPIDHHTIWLFEWNHACDITREFRVFIKGGRIVALAPYYCAVPLEWLTPSNATGIGEKILSFYEETIYEFVHQLFEDAVMDVLYMEDGTVKLIEFNPIVTSGGGLFSWVEDKETLAGDSRLPIMRVVGHICD